MTDKENYKKSYIPCKWDLYNKLKRSEISIEEFSGMLSGNMRFEYNANYESKEG